MSGFKGECYPLSMSGHIKEPPARPCGTAENGLLGRQNTYDLSAHTKSITNLEY